MSPIDVASEVKPSTPTALVASKCAASTLHSPALRSAVLPGNEKRDAMQHSTETMMKSNPTGQKRTDLTKVAACVDACFDCARTCTGCADSCLGETKVDMLKQCIRLNQDCADLCIATGQVLSRVGTGSATISRSLVAACAAACAECATECEKHAKTHEHCRLCAEACRRCEAACKAISAA